MKKVKKYNIIIGSVLILLIGSIIGYNYHIDQINQKGLQFGNELQQLQEEVKQIQNNFYSNITQWEEGDLTKEHLLERLEEHIQKFERIIKKYDKLTPPEPYEASVKLFKSSSQAQYESDIQYIQWLKAGDEAAKTRSDLQLKESVDYELAALNEFNAVKAGQKP